MEGGDFGRGSLAECRVYNGCMGWIHAPPPSLAAPSNFFMNFHHSSIFGILGRGDFGKGFLT
jgi:hypothetical protein